MTTHVEKPGPAAPVKAVPPMIDFARWYGQRGWRVLPLHHVVDGKCSCGNPKQDPKHDYRQGGKHPVHGAWQANATTDLQQINAWWGQRPNANIGIATGEASGIFVLDVDPDNGGFDSLTALQAEHGDLPDTFRDETGSGGLHFFWNWPGFNPRNSAGKLGAGLDIRAEGGQVVAPPSVSVKGPYSRGGAPEPVDAPEWLLALLRPAPPRPTPAPGAFVAPVGNQDAYTQKAVQAECDAIVHAADGEQNDTINRAAFSVGTLVGAGALPEGEARETLLSAARAGHHPEGRALATITSGLRAGMAQPRHPWPPPARADTRNDFSGLLIPEQTVSTPVQVAAEPPEPSANEELTSEEHFEKCVAAMASELLDTDGLDKITPLEPLLGDLLHRNTLARAIGPSGTFKSFVLLDMCGHIGTGLRWHGQYVRQGLVVYLVAEGAEGMRKRVRVWEQHYGVRMDNVRFLPRPVQAMDPEWEVLTEVMRRLAPVLIVVDTQARITVGIEENSNTEMGRVVARLDRLREVTGACVTLVHHTGHQGEHGRGASAVKGALHSELVISRKGDRLNNFVLTIKSGKQKDEEEGDGQQFGLRRVSLDGEFKPDGRPITSLVLVSLDAVPDREPLDGSVEWLVVRLDAANVPNDYGRRRLRTELTRLGIPARDEKLQEVANLRKNRCPTGEPGPTPLPVPGSGTGTTETAGHTGSEPVGNTQEPPPSAPVVPSLFLEREPAAGEPSKCTVCDGELDAKWASQGHDRHVMC
ncbi:bifunctional DNA primase/polymerase [Streptomyces subrutilus]|uniref:bifunctional DNA primase/polymerase n=1 Tax=Streptomyces subrutilus TaxID=36818 RepID=UPI002E0E52FC|nr:bifunctional DNA primase/polymerase [Streptomyces subrutilus]